MADDLLQFAQSIFEDAFHNLNHTSSLLRNAIITALIIFLWIWIYRLAKKLLRTFTPNVKVYNVIRKIIQNVLGAISILLLLGTWINVKNSVLLVAILIIGLTGLSIKNLFNNIVAWFMLLKNKYFKLYDRIEILDIKGDVIKITPIYFKMVERSNNLSSSTATGRVINIPNHVVLNNLVYNYNNFISINWSELKYYITVDSDWKSALEAVEEETTKYLDEFLQHYSEQELKHIEKKFELVDEKLSVKSYLKMEEEYIAIIVQFPNHYTQGTSAQSHLNKEIIPRLNELPNVELNGKTAHIHVDNLGE